MHLLQVASGVDSEDSVLSYAVRHASSQSYLELPSAKHLDTSDDHDGLHHGLNTKLWHSP